MQRLPRRARDERSGRARAAAGGRIVGHCRFCGRAVSETVHGRGAYVVDGFVLHTGESEAAMIRQAESDAIVLVYQRLLRPVVLLTCRECYADPERRGRHQSWVFPVD